MPDSLITSASLGAQTQWGSHHVANVSLDAHVSGAETLFIGRVLVSSTGAVFYFDFVNDPPGASLRLDFTPSQRPITSVGASVASLFGSSDVTNVSQGAIFIGFGQHSLHVGRSIVGRRPPYVLDFSDSFPAHLSLQLSFSGQSLIVARGFDVSAFGIALLPAQIALSGEEFARFGSNARVLLSDLLQFDFVSSVGYATPSISLPLSGALVAPLRGIDATQWGQNSVANASQGVLFASVGHTFVAGTRLLCSGSLYEAVVTFNFLFGPSGVSPALQLSFGANRLARAVGELFTAFGSISVISSPRIYPQPLDSFLAGNFEALGGNKTAFVVGFDSAVFGDDWYIGAARVRPQGLHSLFIGTLIVSGTLPPTARQILLDGLASMYFGNAWVSNAIRFIVDVGLHADPLRFGTLWASFLSRSVAPNSWHSFLPGFARLGTHQQFTTVSFAPHTQFGDAYLYIKAIYPDGFDAASVCDMFFVSRSPRAVDIFSWDSAAYGEFGVFALTQFIYFEPPDTNPDTYRGAVFGDPFRTHVSNRNRQVLVDGFDASRFAWYPADVVPGAVALEAHGFIATGFQSYPYYHLVAYGVRKVFLQGVEAFVTTGRHTVVATGRPVFLSGDDSLRVGVASAQRMLHVVRMFQLLSEQVSLPWVSYDPRAVEMVSTTSFLRLGAGRVSFTPLKVEPSGLVSFSFWNLVVEALPIPTIRPFSAEPSLAFGICDVWNVTPEIRVVGKQMFEDAVNKHRIEYLHRSVLPTGINTFGASLPIVHDATQRAFFVGKCRTVISDHLTVYNDMPDPPYTRHVYMYWPERMDSNIDVTVHGCSRFGQFALRFNILWFESIDDVHLFGVAHVTSNGILFEISKHYLPWGMLEIGAPMVSGGVRHITINWSLDSSLTIVPKFRVTPHTIWLWEYPPAQARANHSADLRYVVVDSYDRNTPNTGVYPFFGITRVLGGNLYILMRHDSRLQEPYLRFGDLKCELFNRAVGMLGLYSFRTGYPRVTTPHDLFIEEVSLGLTSALGTPSVRPWNFTVHLLLGAWSSFVTGRHEVMLLHRAVLMSGNDMTAYGNNLPMVYFYPRGPKMQASSMTQWGTSWFSHSPRTLGIDGLDGLSTAPIPYSRRMRVQNYIRALKVHGGNQFFESTSFVVSAGAARIGVYGVNPPCASPFFGLHHG